MKELAQEIIGIFKELLKPSSIYALIIYGTFAYLALTGKIGADIVANVVLVVVAFYFGKKNSENGGQEK